MENPHLPTNLAPPRTGKGEMVRKVSEPKIEDSCEKNFDGRLCSGQWFYEVVGFGGEIYPEVDLRTEKLR